MQKMRGALFHMYIDSDILRIKLYELKKEVKKRGRNFMPPYQFTIEGLLNAFDEIVDDLEKDNRVKCHGDSYDIKKN